VEQPTNDTLINIKHAVTVLNAFGNALAGDSDDSSRCGSVLELQLDSDQQVIGAGVSSFGLEVSRVTEAHPEQRNFHIFHYCTEGTSGPERDALHLQDPYSYRYLQQNGPFSIPGIDDEAKYHELKAALVALDFTPKERACILRIIALVLHLGNVKFSQPDKQALRVDDREALENVAALMRCEAPDIEDTLCSSGDVLQANRSRDLLARCIYSRLHRWVVHHMHTTLCSKDFVNVMVVLDPPGFEVARGLNGYDQLLRNFGAEKLGKVVDDLAYSRAKEDIIRDEVELPPTFIYPDNRAMIELFEKQGGLLGIMGTAGSGSELISAAMRSFTGHPKISFASRTSTSKKPQNFTLRHRCGAVTYDPSSFMRLDCDLPSPEVLQLIEKSLCRFTKVELFRCGAETLSGFSEPDTHTGHLILQLSSIARVLKATELRFVFCLRPNEQQRAGTFDVMGVVREMRCGGLAAYVQYLSQSLCWRIPYAEFNEHFNALHPDRANQDNDVVENVKQILEAVFGDLNETSSDVLQFGRSKIFLRRAEYVALMTRLRQVQDLAAPQAQAVVRASMEQTEYCAQKASAHILQSWLRGALDRLTYYRQLKDDADFRKRQAERESGEMDLIKEKSAWEEMEREKNAQRAAEAVEAAKATMKQIERELAAPPAQAQGKGSPIAPGSVWPGAVDTIAERMQDYYDGQLEVVQKELELMKEAEREEFLSRDAMRAVDVYHQAIQDSQLRRRDLTPQEESNFMEEEDLLAEQSRIVERAFEGIRRLELLESTIEEEEEEQWPHLDELLVQDVDQLVRNRLDTIDQGGETPEQRVAKENAAEEAKWRAVEKFLEEREHLREEVSPSPAHSPENGDEAAIEAEALESQEELDHLFSDMMSMFDRRGSPHNRPRYREKYDYKYRYNQFEVAHP